MVPCNRDDCSNTTFSLDVGSRAGLEGIGRPVPGSLRYSPRVATSSILRLSRSRSPGALALSNAIIYNSTALITWGITFSGPELKINDSSSYLRRQRPVFLGKKDEEYATGSKARCASILGAKTRRGLEDCRAHHPKPSGRVAARIYLQKLDSPWCLAGLKGYRSPHDGATDIGPEPSLTCLADVRKGGRLVRASSYASN